MFEQKDTNRLLATIVGVLALAGTAFGQPVAIVSDLSGSASNEGVGLEILSEFESGNKVTLADSSSLSVVFYADGRQYSFAGPATFEVDTYGPKMLSGAEPVTDSLHPQGNGAVSIIGLAQLAMVMRGNSSEAKLVLLFPAETTLLSAPKSFEWQEFGTGVGYSFELTDFEGRSMLETTVNGTSLKVPEQLDLVPGAYYTWSLETRLPDGRKYSNWASFSVADSDLLAEVAQRRPDDDQDVSRLVLFALWLEHNELIDEAQKYWRKINNIRPDGKNIRARMGEGSQGD